nr:tyrosine-protein kinase [uncultured bacterium]
MQENKENFNGQFEDTDTINISELIGQYLIHWKWFVFFTIISLAGAYVHLLFSTPQYAVSATILIKDNKNSGVSAELAAFEDLGIIGGGSGNNPDNEIQIMKSRKIIGEVISLLNLDIQYFTEGSIKKTEIYKKNPIEMQFKEKEDPLQRSGASFSIYLKGNDNFDLKDGEGNALGTHVFNETIPSVSGEFIITKTDEFANNTKKEIFISVTKKSNVIDRYRNAVNINTIGKKSSVLELSLNSSVMEKAADFLNELVQQYNTDAIKDKNEVSRKTKDFIDERLLKIGNDLANIQDAIKNYKTENKISGLSSEGELALVISNSNNEEFIKLNTELSIGKLILEDLKNDTSKNKLLPQNLGFTDISIGAAISNYNVLVSNARRLEVNAGSKNPMLVQSKREILAVRLNLEKSIENLIFNLQTQANQLSKQVTELDAQVAAIPVLERGFIDIARQQEIVSGLFSYLLKKKEETAISLAVTVANAKIIDVAYGSNSPIAPKRKRVYMIALVFGMLIPFIIIYIKNLLDTKVHSRKDIDALTTIPFLGDIPHSETAKKVVIDSGARTAAAEAFRLIRTNLDFILPKSKEDLGKIVFITSTTSGEGKSFVSINFAAALSLSNKKVLLVGMDLRAPKVTEYLGVSERKGVTNYITNDKVTLNDIKFSVPEIKGLDIISSGVIPPNPSELLLHTKVSDLFEEVKKDYDFIIIDTAPVSLVTDTLLISKYADMVMYVTRANYLDKRMLNLVQNLYIEKKLPNMAVVLNDTDMTKSYGYYGYGGGYGYGYGNNYIEQVKKPWYKRILG